MLAKRIRHFVSPGLRRNPQCPGQSSVAIVLPATLSSVLLSKPVLDLAAGRSACLRPTMLSVPSSPGRQPAAPPASPRASMVAWRRDAVILWSCPEQITCGLVVIRDSRGAASGPLQTIGASNLRQTILVAPAARGQCGSSRRRSAGAAPLSRRIGRSVPRPGAKVPVVAISSSPSINLRKKSARPRAPAVPGERSLIRGILVANARPANHGVQLPGRGVARSQPGRRERAVSAPYGRQRRSPARRGRLQR